MADNISALLGLQPNNMNALADSLRGEQRMGDYYSMSTLSPIAQYGQQLQQRSQQAAKQGGSLSQALEKEATRKAEREQDYQRGLEASTLAHDRRMSHAQAQKKADELKFDDFKPYVRGGKPVYISQKGSEVFELDENGDIKKTTMEGVSPYEKPSTSSSKSSSNNTKLGGTVTSRDKVAKEAARHIQPFNIFKEYKEDYSNITDVPFTDGVEGLPFVSQLENTMAKYAPVVTDEKSEEKAGWWSNYKQFYENPERHKLYGAALTPGEMRQWELANVTPSMTDKQIREKLAIQADLSKKVMEYYKDLQSTEYAPEFLDKVYGKPMALADEVMGLTEELSDEDIILKYGGG